MTSPNAAIRRASIGKPEAWQSEAWRFYDSIGELRFGVSWIANALSRVNLIAAMPPLGPGDEPTPIDLDDPRTTAVQRRAIEIVATIAEGASGQGQMLSSFGIHLSVAGIAWLVIEPDPDDPDADIFDSWEVYSSDEVQTNQSGQIEIRTGARSWRPVHPNAVIVKVWRKHPRFSYLADAPTRAVLNVLHEIELLTQHVQATAQSRLAGAGILAIPSEATFPPGQGPQPNSDDDTFAPEDTFVDTLIDTMTVPLTDRSSAASVVPLVVKVPGELVDKITHITFSTPFDDRVMELMEGAIKRLALGLDIPPEVLTGMGQSNHWCLPESAKSYTPEGWRSLDDLNIGDRIATFDTATGHMKFEPIQHLYVAEVTEEPMVSVGMIGQGGHITTVQMTPEHRNVVQRDGEWQIVRATELVEGDVIPMSAPITEFTTEPKFSDAFVKLIAWYSADGTLTNRDGKPGQIRIGKSWKKNPHSVDKLVATLTEAFGPASESMPHGSDEPMWRMEMQDRGMAMAVLNAAARDIILSVVPDWSKAIPRWFVESLTEAQTHMFLDAWAESDGETSGGKFIGNISQSDPERLDSIEYAAVRLGKSVRRWVQDQTDSKDHGRFSDRPLHMLRIGRSDYRKIRSIEASTYTGVVWCPTTATGTWMAQADNGWAFFTGNSAWQVAEEAITLHVEPLAETITHALTIGYLVPALEAEGFGPDDIQQVMVWYDTSDLRTRPNLGQAAVEAYDRMELSGEAMVRELGLAVDEMPDDEEMRERILLAVAQSIPSAAPLILRELGVLSAETAAELAGGSARNEDVRQPAGPTEPDITVEGPPETDEVIVSSALAAACDMMVRRALERAGQRLRNAAGKKVPGGAAAIKVEDVTTFHVEIDASQYTDFESLLDGAWTFVPEIAERYGMDGDRLRSILDTYTRALIGSRQEHNYGRLAVALGS